MPAPNPAWDDIVTTAIENRQKAFADNMTKNIPLLNYLNKRGNIKPFDGGRTIVQELEYQDNATFQWYSGAEQLNVSASETFTAAEFAIKQASVFVVLTGLEMIQNSGGSRMIDLLESRIRNAEGTMENQIDAALYSDGTGSGGKEIGGLRLLVPDDPTVGTVGGIPRNTFTFWRSFKFAGVADGGAAVSATNIQKYMNQVIMKTTRNRDKSDVIFGDNNYYGFFWDSLQAIQRVVREDGAAALYGGLSYGPEVDVILAGGVGGAITANHMYFLNTKYIHWRPFEGRNMVQVPGNRISVNQDVIAKMIVFAGNATLSNASLQGVLIA